MKRDSQQLPTLGGLSELSEKDLKAAMVEMLKQAITLEINAKIESSAKKQKVSARKYEEELNEHFNN